MNLPPGTRIGHYEVVTPEGAGGMGEVYRARDTRLDRNVAIKSLPRAFASDPGRLSRFDREAKLLASLNHPNIASIYGLEDASGSPYLVLEFVEGETLAKRLTRGRLSVRETLEIGEQIASAIDAAHQRGIVHRDLKPGNVMLTASGTVKVLDFGLATGTASEDGSGPDLSSSPTMSIGGTGDGVILGTAPYMSPEQARGKSVDRRADVWALGCVLYECLTGRQAFEGETTSDVIARILERDVDWAALPAGVPPRLRDLVQRCLTKEASQRPRDIGDLRGELAAIASQMKVPGSGRPTADMPSLAVLYFENLSNDSESEYFCAGITEDILTDLSKIKGLRVASRNAVARYRGAPADLPRVGAELGVKTVLEGSVRRAGDRVRISAQLISAADGFHIWAERYDRTLADVFAVQEEIAKSIAEALRGALTPAESQALGRDRPDDVRAYDLYLRGREQYGKYTRESLSKALKLFQQAIQVDPEYALAWAGVADSHGQMLQYGMSGKPEEAARLGLTAARRAIAIDPQLAEAHKAEALVLRFTGDIDGSRASLLRAVGVNPRFAPALINLAVDAFGNGQVAGAERYIRRALEIDPLEPFATTWLIQVLMDTSREEEALTLTRHLRTLSDDPFYKGLTHVMPAWAHLHRGDLAAAGEDARNAALDGIARGPILAIEVSIAVREGREAEARAMLRETENTPRLGPGSLAMAADAALRIGEIDLAARFFQRKFIADLSPCIIRLNPELHPLLDHEPFAPRRSPLTLVWPLEAPMIDAARHALFKDVRIESGIPQASSP